MFYYNVFLKGGRTIKTKPVNYNPLDIFEKGVTPSVENEKALVKFGNVLVVASEIVAIEVKESE